MSPAGGTRPAGGASDLATLPPLHPDRVRAALRDVKRLGEGMSPTHETCLKALEVITKLQTGFGFAPDLYDKVEMVKRTTEQGRTVFGFIKGLMK